MLKLRIDLKYSRRFLSLIALIPNPSPKGRREIA